MRENRERSFRERTHFKVTMLACLSTKRNQVRDEKPIAAAAVRTPLRRLPWARNVSTLQDMKQRYPAAAARSLTRARAQSPRLDGNGEASLVVLAMIASVEAIFLSTFVMISQNRMDRAARRHAELDLQINLLKEHEITRECRPSPSTSAPKPTSITRWRNWREMSRPKPFWPKSRRSTPPAW
jgi:hypothetical protein